MTPFAFVLLAAIVSLLNGAATALAASSPPSPKTVVVTGATGKVGSRLVQQLLDDDDSDTPTKVVALVRNATKTASMFATAEGGGGGSHLEIVEANFDSPDELEEAIKSNVHEPFGLFLACGNGPNQEELEVNVAAAAAASSHASFCVKLSTAQPLVEGSIGVGAIHRKIEDYVSDLFGNRCCFLRPHLFFQMLDPAMGGPLMGLALRDSSSCEHMFANAEMPIIDCEDVAACAKSILLSENPASEHGGCVYELTGPKQASLSKTFAQVLPVLQPSNDPISITPCLVEQQIVSAGMPPSATKQISPFLNALASYSTTTTDVERITGRPPKTIAQSIFQNPRPFLPRTFRRVVAKSKSASFREAAQVVESSLDDEFHQLENDEILVKVQVAGVNGGADTFSVTRASEDDTNFPLGNEGTGIVVACGTNVTTHQPGDSTVFIGRGAYGEYVRVKERMCYAVGNTRSKATPAELTALRISALTALVALERTAPVQSGDVVLVSASCGGTGHFAAQIAKNAGATVIGTVGSSAKASYAKALGVDRVVDLSKEDLGDVLQKEYPQGINVAYEGVGGALLKDVCDNLADNGCVLIVGSISQYPHNEELESHDIDGVGNIMDVFRSGKTVELDRGRNLIGNVWGDIFGSSDMKQFKERVYELNSNGKLRVLLDEENKFDGIGSVCDAVDHMLSRKSVGKVYVQISD